MDSQFLCVFFFLKKTHCQKPANSLRRIECVILYLQTLFSLRLQWRLNFTKGKNPISVLVACVYVCMSVCLYVCMCVCVCVCVTTCSSESINRIGVWLAPTGQNWSTDNARLMLFFVNLDLDLRQGQMWKSTKCKYLIGKK